jgi:DNA-binding cell septation regulator SpoVG
VTYRLEPAGWRPVDSGVRATLRAIAARAVDDAVVVGDDAVVLIWSGAWERLRAPVAVTFRAALRVGEATFIAGDQGTLLRLSGGAASPSFARVDLGTTCTLRGLFSRGDEVWVAGSDGGHAAVWRIAGGTVFRWGQCP